jgi:hypothetical protein
MAAINLPSNLAFSFVMWTRIQKANNFASTIPLRSEHAWIKRNEKIREIIFFIRFGFYKKNN